jgi:transposase
MMGRLAGDQAKLFYEFDLDSRVPSDHLLRKIGSVLDLKDLRRQLKPFYSHTGRPSIDPELMIRMLLIGYCYGIRSERRLCEEVSLNLAYRWFCRLGLEDEVPDHSTFSKNRHGRFRESDIFRHLFEAVVRRCMEVGLVGGEGFAVDASVVEADASRYKRVEEGEPLEWSDQQLSMRPVREYLAAIESENPPTNPTRRPKAMSPSDPSAAWTTRGRNKVQFGYSLNYLIDVKEAVILDVEATPTRISKEVEATETMIERTQERLRLLPRRLAADVAYGTGELLGWLVEHDIEPHIPVWDKSKREDGTLSREDFRFDEATDTYICPAGHRLTTTGTLVNDGATLKYRGSTKYCAPCPLKAKCCPNTPVRKIPRDIHEGARDRARMLAGTEAYVQSGRERKKIEVLFGDVKRNLALTRLRLRGLSGASDEFLLTAIVQNLRRLAKHAVRPPI